MVGEGGRGAPGPFREEKREERLWLRMPRGPAPAGAHARPGHEYANIFVFGAGLTRLAPGAPPTTHTLQGGQEARGEGRETGATWGLRGAQVLELADE